MALTKVRYKGLSDVRIIEAKDPGLKARGIAIEKDMMWTRNSSIIVEDMSPEMEKMFREDGAFTVTEVDKETKAEGQEIIKATKVDDSGSTVKDNTTGQVSKKS